MQINGIAHIMIVVRNFDRCRKFYRPLLQFMGMTPVIDAEEMLYCVGGRTAFGIRPCAPEFAGEPFDQRRPGLHHICFRARERDDVDALHAYLKDLGATIVHPPEEASWAPGYYSVLFEDPEGTRLEMNFVPGRGLLAGREGKGE